MNEQALPDEMQARFCAKGICNAGEEHVASCTRWTPWERENYAKVYEARRILSAPESVPVAPEGPAPTHLELLKLARPYLEADSERCYDGTNGHGMRKEAARRLALIDAALAAQPEAAFAPDMELKNQRERDIYTEGRRDGWEESRRFAQTEAPRQPQALKPRPAQAARADWKSSAALTSAPEQAAPGVEAAHPTLEQFISALNAFGWRAHADAQHEGIAELHAQLWPKQAAPERSEPT